jgi:hypothetical protein
MIAVETLPHVGVDIASGIETRHDQDIVLVDGREVGYLTEKPSHRPNLILFAPVSEAELAVLTERCCTLRGGCRCKVVNPPPDIPPEFLETEDEEED